MSLDSLTAFHGRLSDMKAVWWPFLFLKPESDVRIGLGRIAAMTLCFAAWFLLLWMLRKWISGGMADVSPAWAATTYFWLLVAFGAWFCSVTAPLWNRRADSMRRLNGLQEEKSGGGEPAPRLTS